MMRFWVGETVRVAAAFTDDAGQPMAAAGVEIRAKPPGAASVVGTLHPVDGQIGQYEADFGTPSSGKWAVRVSCTGPTPAAAEAEFIVAPSLVL